MGKSPNLQECIFDNMALYFEWRINGDFAHWQGVPYKIITNNWTTKKNSILIIIWYGAPCMYS